MSVVCHFDDTTHDTVEELHTHLRMLRIKREDYYHEYLPRRDLLTGELIPFKDLNQYLSQDFVNKNTLRKWVTQNPKEGFEWSKGWLTKRKVEKRLVYAPSQVELRTLCCPSMPYYEAVGKQDGGYYGVTSALGYAPRYVKTDLVYAPLARDAVVVQDSREQDPVKLSISTRINTVNVGDYALAEPYDLGVRIERKSLSDFCGTLSGRKMTRANKGGTTQWSNLERFDRELARAKESNLYVVMMVEASLADAQRFNYLPQTKWVKAAPEYIFHNVRDLLTKYPLTFQAVFIDGRAHMADKMMRVFQLGAQVRSTDLQFAYEEGLL